MGCLGIAFQIDLALVQSVGSHFETQLHPGTSFEGFAAERMTFRRVSPLGGSQAIEHLLAAGYSIAEYWEADYLGVRANWVWVVAK